jgi:hypothetical protein
MKIKAETVKSGFGESDGVETLLQYLISAEEITFL